MNILLCKKLDDAIVAYIIKKWNENSDVKLGRTVLQKICYFAKSKNVPLSYDFDIYRYGPFSHDLYYRMEDMSADGIITDKMISSNTAGINSRTNKSQYLIGENAEELLNLHNDKLNQYTENIDSVIDLFSEFQHKDLELLSTLHFFHATLTNFYNKPAEKEEVIARVKKAKAKKFDDEFISQAYDALVKAGIFAW